MRSAIAAAYLSRSRRPPAPLLAAVAVVCALALSAAGAARAASAFLIRGGGYGHGIGMSQYGADGYALHGRGYRWILARYYQGTAIGHLNPGRPVRVLLATGSGSATITGAGQIAGKRVKPGWSYVIRPNADGTIAVLRTSGKKVGTFAAPLTVTGPAPLTLAGVGTYHGALEFRPDGSGGLETINVVDLEDYVRDVIAAEMPSSWAAEALKAQAVAARTYALTSDAGGSVFDVYPDTRSQMYGGVGAETASTDAAVAATRGQVVTYQGAPVVTYFFSSSGGHTENIENVWPGATPEPWLRGIPDRYDGAAGDPYHRWSDRLTVAAAAAKLGSLVRGRLIGIQVMKTGSSPRILLARVLGTRGSTTVTGIQLQHAFGLLTTYAAFTTISIEPGRSPSAAVRSALAGRLARSQALVALVPLLDDLLNGAANGVHGSVFPSPAGVPFGLQRLRGGQWRTVRHLRTGAGGTFDTPVPGHGTYRIVIRGQTGPAVRVG